MEASLHLLQLYLSIIHLHMPGYSFRPIENNFAPRALARMPGPRTSAQSGTLHDTPCRAVRLDGIPFPFSVRALLAALLLR